MNGNGSRAVLPLGYGVRNDKIMNALMEESDGSDKSHRTSTNDEHGCSTRKRHIENVKGEV